MGFYCVNTLVAIGPDGDVAALVAAVRGLDDDTDPAPSDLCLRTIVAPPTELADRSDDHAWWASSHWGTTGPARDVVARSCAPGVHQWTYTTLGDPPLTALAVLGSAWPRVTLIAHWLEPAGMYTGVRVIEGRGRTLDEQLPLAASLAVAGRHGLITGDGQVNPIPPGAGRGELSALARGSSGERSPYAAHAIVDVRQGARLLIAADLTWQDALTQADPSTDADATVEGWLGSRETPSLTFHLLGAACGDLLTAGRTGNDDADARLLALGSILDRANDAPSGEIWEAGPARDTTPDWGYLAWYAAWRDILAADIDLPCAWQLAATVHGSCAGADQLAATVTETLAASRGPHSRS